MSKSDDLETTPVYNTIMKVMKRTEGVGIVEAPRGILTHHYWTDERGALTIDAINAGGKPAGNVTSFRLEELANPNAGHLASAHDATLQTALALGRTLGARLPREVLVVAIEAPMCITLTKSFRRRSPKQSRAQLNWP